MLPPPDDADLAALFATERGERVLLALEASWGVLVAPQIRAAIARERRKWAEGAPVATLPP